MLSLRRGTGLKGNRIGLWLPYSILVGLVFGIQRCWSLNSEGYALLHLRARVSSDPYGALVNWNPDDSSPCRWSGIGCVDGQVQVLDLNGRSLEGTLAPELGELRQLRSLVLNKNNFSGPIPEELGGLTKLELLDLRHNNLRGPIPTQLGRISSLKHLLLGDNKFEGSIPLELRKLSCLSEFQFNKNLASAVAIGMCCTNRKLGHCIWQSGLKKLYKAESVIHPIKKVLVQYLNGLLLPGFTTRKISLPGQGDKYQHSIPRSYEPKMARNVQSLVTFARRRLLEHSANLPAASADTQPMSAQIITLPSGSFPAVTNWKKGQNVPPPVEHTPTPVQHTHSAPIKKSPRESGTSKWKFIWVLPTIGVLFIVFVAACFLVHNQGMKAISPWKTGLSGQLQKALVKGIPKLNRSELETACEDFSNIIETLDGCTVYKGTLSSGVEIAVASTAVKSLKEWSDSAELAFRKKVDTLSRVSHKNFVNLIGYCEDNEPFSRMMVFEYASNGSLFEHLHVKEMEHIDWFARMRIIMGTAYCLQYMHHDLNPPVAHTNLNTSAIYLTEDYAAKIAEINFGAHPSAKIKNPKDESDLERNVYSLGILLLEIISGKLPYSEEEGHLVNWAAKFFDSKQSFSFLIDPTLQSFKDNELVVICEVIQECIQEDPRKRPSMKDITSKLREGISISPDQAIPSLSPLWWAELEILSAEAT